MDETILTARLEGVKRTPSGWMARCPAHGDRSPSLKISVGVNGLLIHCFAGCSAGDILAAVGLELADLFPEPLAEERKERQRGDWLRRKVVVDQRRLEQHLDAQTRARFLWSDSQPAFVGHPYLVRKKVLPFGIRQRGDRLQIPMTDADGVLWGLQSIDADGSKMFLRGQRVSGLRHLIGDDPITHTVMVCEGYATGGSLHGATGAPVAVAFNCMNLLPVAVALRGKYPYTKILICGDNDWETEQRTGKNPGKEGAQRAASAVGGILILPDAPK
jgi:putative DNA primase/helicase